MHSNKYFLDACATHACQHGGKCSVKNNQPTCKCEGRFSGPKCQKGREVLNFPLKLLRVCYVFICTTLWFFITFHLETIAITIHKIDGSKFVVNILSTKTIFDLRTKIKKLKGLSLENLHFEFKRREVPDIGRTLMEMGIKHKSDLQMVQDPAGINEMRI